MNSFNWLLGNSEIDYVGTRLHGGIRALQKGRRTIIIGIDNRAIEIEKNINFNIVNFENLSELENRINSKWETELNIDEANITKWKKSILN